jgi:hypothetical protein
MEIVARDEENSHQCAKQKVFSMRRTLVGALVIDLTRFRESSSALKIVSFLEKTYWLQP